MATDTALAIGQRVALIDGDDRVSGYGTVAGVATYWGEDPTDLEPVRGYVVRLEGDYRGWIATGDPATSGRSYVSLAVAHPSSLRPIN